MGRIDPEIEEIFNSFCQFVWVQGEPLPLIYNVLDQVYTKQGITLSVLKTLEESGLILFEKSGFVKKRFGKHTRLFYFGKPTKIGFLNDMDNQLDLGCVLFTELGKKKALASNARMNQDFYEYVIKQWYSLGFVLSSIQIQK